MTCIGTCMCCLINAFNEVFDVSVLPEMVGIQ